MHIPFPKMKIKRKNECKMVKKKRKKKKETRLNMERPIPGQLLAATLRNVGVRVTVVVVRWWFPSTIEGTIAMTSRRRVFLVGVSDLARMRATVILTKPWSRRRAIRTTTGRALRVGRWSAPKPPKKKKKRRGRRRTE